MINLNIFSFISIKANEEYDMVTREAKIIVNIDTKIGRLERQHHD